MKRLTKSQNKRIAGVCGGISEYINPELDPLLVRVAYLVLTFFNPLLIILYFILAIAMPDSGMANGR